MDAREEVSDEIMNRLLSTLGAEGREQVQDLLSIRNEIMFNMDRIAFLENEIEISTEFHLPNPMTKANGEEWISSCRKKIGLIKAYLRNKYSVSI